jgi:hypothetical protein
VGLSGQVQRDFSLSKTAFWPLQAPFTKIWIWFFQTTFAKWPCSRSHGWPYCRINRNIAAPVIPASLVRLTNKAYVHVVRELARCKGQPRIPTISRLDAASNDQLKIVRQLLTIELRLRARVIPNGLSAQIIGKDNAGNNRDSKQDCRKSKKLEVVVSTSRGE